MARQDIDADVSAAVPRETSRALPIALLRARESVMSRIRPILAERGLTDQQWRVLRVLEESGPHDPTELSERCVILTPSMTRILRSLQTQDMITRSTHPNDGRRVLITITDRAREAIRVATPAANAVYEEIEKLYGEKKMRELLDMLEALAQTRPNR